MSLKWIQLQVDFWTTQKFCWSVCPSVHLVTLIELSLWPALSFGNKRMNRQITMSCPHGACDLAGKMNTGQAGEHYKDGVVFWEQDPTSLRAESLISWPGLQDPRWCSPWWLHHTTPLWGSVTLGFQHPCTLLLCLHLPLTGENILSRVFLRVQLKCLIFGNALLAALFILNSIQFHRVEMDYKT